MFLTAPPLLTQGGVVELSQMALNDNKTPWPIIWVAIHEPPFKIDLTTPSLKSVGVVTDPKNNLDYGWRIKKRVAKNRNDLT